MDIPFPSTAPRIIDSKWFNADNPCDEEAELTALEQSNQSWVWTSGHHFINLLTAKDGTIRHNAHNSCDVYRACRILWLARFGVRKLSSVGQQYRVRTPLGKPNPEPMEECESEEEDGNEESDESEESHDEDEEEDVQQIYIQQRPHIDSVRHQLDLTDSSELNTTHQNTLWP